MPQLDISIFFHQTSFIFLFITGYFLFLKSILPLVSAELKIKEKLIYKHMLWFKNHMHYMIFFRIYNSKLLIKSRAVLKLIHFFNNKRNIFYGIYSLDSLLLRRAIDKQKKNSI